MGRPGGGCVGRADCLCARSALLVRRLSSGRVVLRDRGHGIRLPVSAYPSLAFLKGTSLLLLFLYGSTGARLAVMERTAVFFSALLIGCELLVYVSAILYFIFRSEIFGNPNSMGAVMGVVTAPLLLWGILVSERPTTRWRRTFAFALALALLLSSYARAGIAGALVSCILLCISVRRYGLLLAGTCVALLLAALVATTVRISNHPIHSPPCFCTKAIEKPAFSPPANLFGTIQFPPSKTTPGWAAGSEPVRQSATWCGNRVASNRCARRHGNMAIATWQLQEWVGVVGDIPFFALVILIAVNVVRTLAQTRRTRNVFSPALPLAAVLAAGLVHAAFEDWLFAVGYYLCIFFWSLGFHHGGSAPSPAN